MNRLEEILAQDLSHLQEINRLRTLHSSYADHPQMINLASNDYLYLAHDLKIFEEFKRHSSDRCIPYSSTSSRLLDGNHDLFTQVEKTLAEWYGKEEALFMNSGYHMNIGLLPALSTTKSLILADKLVHASIIDGIRLSKAQCIRYRHMDYEQLETLVNKYHDDKDIIFIVTESIFSMDGDITDLRKLTDIKKRYDNVILYVDEAHAVGVRGAQGRGVAEEQGCMRDIDLLCGTCGKALASQGGYVVCSKIIKEFLVNHCRSLIYTTALSPQQMAWMLFVLRHISHYDQQRKNLIHTSTWLKTQLANKGYVSGSQSHIIPIMIGDDKKMLSLKERLYSKGYLTQGIRPPTVPENTARIRLSLHSHISQEELMELINSL